MTPTSIADAVAQLDKLHADLAAADNLIVRLVLERHALRQQLAQLAGDQ